MPRRDDLARVESWQWGMQSASARTPSARPASFPFSGARASWPISTPRSRRRRPGTAASCCSPASPGIGKTRLATALGERAAADGHRVAWARGWDGGGAPAFWPWVQVVRALAADRDDDALRTELGAGARWVAQLAPELRERLDLPEAGDLESEQARFALFDAVTVFLRNTAGREPLVVLLDDLHTADLPSLLLLAFLARALSETRVLVITTHHEAGPRRGPEVEAVFGELTRFGVRFDLGGLERRRPARAGHPPQRRRPARGARAHAARADRGQPLLLRRGRAPARRPGPHRPAAGRARPVARRGPRRDPQAPAAAAPRGPRRAPGGRRRGPRLPAHHRRAGRGHRARRPPRAPRRGARRAAARGGAGTGRVVPLRPRPHPRDALRRPHRLAPRAPARRRRRGPRAHGRERGRAGPPLRRGGARSAIRPRRWSTPTAPATRRWPRWPTSAPPTSSTPR